MPASRKPAARRQNRATKDTVVELVAGGLVVPEAPERWLAETADEWSAFWRDEELVSLVRESHRPSLVRLFDWRDRLRRAWAQADSLRDAIGAEHFTTGSTGQVKANPLYERAEKAEAAALQIEGRVEALEDRFGLTPGSMLKLGVDFQRRQSLAAANARMTEALGGSRDGGSSDDPRSLPGDSAVGPA